MDFAFGTIEPVLCALQALPSQELQHMKRVGILTGLFTQYLADMGFFNLHAEDFQFFGQAASYHDIGKAWVDSAILTKPGKLTAQEQDAMCRHPEFSLKLFDQMADFSFTDTENQFLRLLRSCALYHHEWWNGGGYPYRKAYDEIPVIARITAICDAYDAMTSNRVYRAAHTHDFACRELMRCAGTQFQPALVLKFVSSHINLADVIRLRSAGF